jgi:hypothetical protein
MPIEVLPHELRDSEYDMAVGYFERYTLRDELAGLEHVFLHARWTKTSASARKR